MNRPITVGVTGGIGVGKTLVTKLFALLNVPIYNADDRAKTLMNSVLVDEIVSAFGSESYKEGTLNRGYISSKVFANKHELAKLNAIVHPVVATDFEKWVFQNKSFKYLIKEAALLVESGSYKKLDKLIVVTAPSVLRVERVKKRDSFRSEDEIANIIKSQISEAERLQLADYIINNNETEMLIPQVLKLDKKIRQH